MAEDVEIPKVGKLPKKVLIPLAVGLAGFVAWRFWTAQNGTGDDGDSTIEDGEFGAIDSGIPGVIGGVRPGNDYGSGDSGNDDDAGNDPTRFTTNAQWSNYVRNQLLSSYEDSAVTGALGNYLGSQPLSTEQQTIVRAAIAVGGYPPVGTFSVIPGGNTGITVAPGGVKVSNVTETSAQVSFNYVAGAGSYRVYRNGAQVASGGGSPMTITGLSGGQTYSVTVAAVTSGGTAGPQSGAVSFKTPAKPAVAVGAISGRKTTPARTSIHTTFKGATGAVRYNVSLDGRLWNTISGPPFTIPGLKPNTRYTISIRAVGSDGRLGPVSNTIIRTKK